MVDCYKISAFLTSASTVNNWTIGGLWTINTTLLRSYRSLFMDGDFSYNMVLGKILHSTMFMSTSHQLTTF